MKMRMLLVVIAGSLVGCSGGPAATSQLSYNLTVASDRAQWKPVGLTFEKVVGPYAIYRVTGPEQRLDGPRVRMSAVSGGAILSATTGYFPGTKSAGPLVLALRAGDTTLALSTMAPTADGNCTPPSDSGGGGSAVDGGAPPSFDSPDGGTANTSDGGSNWGSGCTGDTSGSGGGGSNGSGGYGSGGGSNGGGGYGSGGGGSNGGGGYGSGGGGYGSGGGSNGGGGYGNSGGYSNGGWNSSGCMDAGAPPVFTPPDAGSSNTGSSDTGTPSVTVQILHSVPIGSTVAIRRLVVGGGDVSPSGLVPSVCCTDGNCDLPSDTPPVQ